MSLLYRAQRLATELHDRQFRKWQVAVPYISHPMHVAHAVSTVEVMEEHGEILVAAAWLHDTIEDCAIDGAYLIERLRHPRGPEVAQLVEELTNPSKQHHTLNRTDRKAMDRAHAMGMSRGAKLIKLADRAHNLRESIQAPESFRKLYLEESKLLFPMLADSDDELEEQYQEAMAILRGRV